MDTPKQKAIFFDRDDTLISDTCYGTDSEQLSTLPGVVDGLKHLQAAGYTLVICTNQSGVARGYFSEAALDQFHSHMLAWFAGKGIHFAKIYHCPHYTEGDVDAYVLACDCRKPEPGMLWRAAEDLDIDLAQSWMVGDRPADVGAGHAAGCRTVRVLTGQPPQDGDPEPDFIVPNFAEAAERILAAE
jgi:D-glycero-D-manno-heptose 1,7-bisphosphate phosphatase